MKTVELCVCVPLPQTTEPGQWQQRPPGQSPCHDHSSQSLKHQHNKAAIINHTWQYTATKYALFFLRRVLGQIQDSVPQDCSLCMIVCMSSAVMIIPLDIKITLGRDRLKQVVSKGMFLRGYIPDRHHTKLKHAEVGRANCSSTGAHGHRNSVQHSGT